MINITFPKIEVLHEKMSCHFSQNVSDIGQKNVIFHRTKVLEEKMVQLLKGPRCTKRGEENPQQILRDPLFSKHQELWG